MKRLTLEQVEEYRKKGLCFRCDEKFNPGHKCSIKKLILIEIGDPEEEEEEILLEPKENRKGKDVEFSIHAMEGKFLSNNYANGSYQQ